jgi:hypothetical protein
MLKIVNRKEFLEALRRGFPFTSPLESLPDGRQGQNCFFAVLGEVEYKISVFDIHVKMKPAKYPYGFASGIVGFKKFFI